MRLAAGPITLLLVVLSLLAPTASGLAGTVPATSLHTSILALDSARRTVFLELEGNRLSATEAADYTDFIAYLNTQIVNYCLDVAKQEGPAALAELPCPAVAGGALAATDPGDTVQPAPSLPLLPPAETKAQTEQTAAIEAKLSAALAEFDDMLLKEEEKIAARVPSQRESGLANRSGGSGSNSAGREDGPSPAAADQGPGDPAGTASTPGKTRGQATTADASSSGHQDSSGAGKGTTGSQVTQTRHGAPGGTLPPPGDDDIVARQLREAAEKEPDPELRAKLWEEYWKYKGVKKGG